uniref:NADH-ubiquinone oxidoreductase chain 3 n=1 Tax=Rhacophorus jarujini TaxID=402887 RepID=A7J1L9_9NEOB|nr:NADH dehydrogenase subunit 3 [Rhacophorus jarujini]ABI74606.1 NADH dehydrogenase subunit 3 [Rhacophorus jarujini]
MLIFLSMTLTVSVLLSALSFWLPTLLPDTEKLSPYECGFDPLGTARLPYSMRFFLVGILFLLFDLEIALLLPLPWAMHLPSPPTVVMWALVIIFLLTVGFIHEWYQAGLEWAE